MAKIRPSEQYTAEIYELLINSFDDENEDKMWDLDKIDATAWFTGLVKASAMIFNQLTDNEKNFIEWTHVSQNLIIQDIVKDKEEVA